MSDELLAGLGVEERVALGAGVDLWHTAAIPHAGIPSLRMTDGPNGARGPQLGVPSTCFPVGSALAATFDLDLVADVGRALAAECREKGAGLLLAPTVNLHRHPLAGRNFEAFSEDPFLTARLAVAYIGGVQSRGVGACIKHLVGNESEFERHTMSSEIDERTLREAYLQPFEAAVREAGVWAVMASYNRLNGTPASDHRCLFTDVLRHEWGFDGAVVSDWGGTRSTIEALEAGLDIEMPGPARLRGVRLQAAVDRGEVDPAALDRAAVATTRLARRAADGEAELGDGPDPAEVAARAAVQSLVLLTNDGTLPLAADLDRLAVIGPNADPGQVHGGGSSRVTPRDPVSPLRGVTERLGGAGTAVVHAPGGRIDRFARPLRAPRITAPDGRPGAVVELFDGPEPTGTPVSSRSAKGMALTFFGEVEGVADQRRFSARVTAVHEPAVTGTHVVGLACAGRARLLLDGRVVAEARSDGGSAGPTFFGFGSDEIRAEVELRAGEPVEVVAEFVRADDDGGGAELAGMLVGISEPEPGDPVAEAAAVAAGADAAVVVVGLDGAWETEGIDRAGLELPGRQDELVAAVAAVNRRTIVVVNAGSPVAMPWVDDVAAVVQAWYPGEAFGSALAAVLFGDEGPSGRLPTTFPRRIDDAPAHGNYPGAGGRVVYAEGLHLGHRHYERAGIEPLFPFGHGLTYTTFAYGPARLSATEVGPGETVHVEVPVTNTGSRAGVEVVQLYVTHPEARVDRPVVELRGFARLELAPGETGSARFGVGPDDLSRWDPAERRWAVDPGPVELAIGSSIRNVRLRTRFDVIA